MAIIHQYRAIISNICKLLVNGRGEWQLFVDFVKGKITENSRTIPTWLAGTGKNGVFWGDVHALFTTIAIQRHKYVVKYSIYTLL